MTYIEDAIRSFQFDPWNANSWRRARKPKVFISGPMFSVSEKSEQLSIATALELAGFSTIVPHRDGIEVAPVMNLLNSEDVATLLDPRIIDRCIAWVTRAIACLDMYWATTSRCTVLNIDGRVPDEGSLVEATAAWMNGRPVIVYQTTSIRKLGKNNNPMIGVISNWTRSESTLEGVVTAVTEAMSGPQSPAPVNGNTAAVIEVGKCISDYLMGTGLDTFPISNIRVIEPTRELRDTCMFAVRTIMNFSQSDNESERIQILLDGIEGVNLMSKGAEIHPIPC